jgi:hypothetical protein
LSNYNKNMGEVLRRQAVLGAVAPVLACVVPVALAGCLEAAELEAPERFDALKKPAPPTNCDEPLPSADAVDCQWEARLRQYCGRSACHGTALASAGLNLGLDPTFIARMLDQPATHEGNTCGGVPCVPAPDACDRCNECPTGALLLDSANPSASWILRKMEPLVPGAPSNVNIGCGDAMPSFNTGSDVRDYSDADKTCLTQFFTHIATNTPNPERWPCTVSVDGGTDGGTSP